MPVPSLITDLTTVAATNSPAGSESPATADDYFRAHASFIAQMRAVIGGTANPNIPTDPKVYTRSTILGAVSQLTGSPTGALIEVGANGNGRYTKFADGTMICTHVLLGTGYNLSASSYISWVFPAAFSAEPITSGLAKRAALDSVSLFIRGGPAASTYASFAHSDTAATAVNFNLMAIGRWF